MTKLIFFSAKNVFFKSKGIKYELNTIIQRIKFGYTCERA